MAEKYYSIAESKNRLPAIIHEAEENDPIFIHRRGKAVAVLLSMDSYNQLKTQELPSLIRFYRQFRSKWDTEPQAFLQDQDMQGLRETSLGREPQL